MKKWFLTLAILFSSFLAAETSYYQVPDECTLKILTPDLADLKTAKIRLSNGLEAYLVSDPGAHMSATALSVNAGSWQDPDEYPGMAHFLEHMLFMGTEAYPKEFEYMQYIHDHGGDVNAYTASDRTVYGFSINHEGLKGAIDRFSHFFIDPLFHPSSIGRELHAVDQEHGKNVEHDLWRAYMVLKETGNPTHPNRGFGTGNASTLSGIPSKALQEWYQTHYSANRMHLVIVSSLPIEEMVTLAVDHFSPIINRNLPPPTYPFELFSKEQLGHLLYIKPVKDLKRLSLTWQLPISIAMDQETHVSELVTYALENGTENGLSEELKREKLIEELSVSTNQLSQECMLMDIGLSLTEKGVKNLDAVIERTFQALARLRETGIPRFIFDEQKRLATIGYEYQSRDDAFTVVMDIAGDLSYEKLETYPQKTVAASIYDPDQVHTLLHALTPQSCIYLVLADSKWTGISPTMHEKWMNAAYTLREVPQEKLTAWAEVPPHAQIDLPPPNPYLPDSLALVPSTSPPALAPETISHDELGHLYFQQDQKYRVPEVGAIFSIKTPAMEGSAKSRVLFDLYIRALEEALNSTLFFASEARLCLKLSQSDDNFVISIDGYSEKMPLFLNTIFSSLHHVSPTAAEFEVYKKSLLSSYDNASKELPLRQGMQLLNSILFNDNPTPKARHQALQEISYEHFLSFAHEVFQKTYTEALIYGNLSRTEAEDIWSDFRTALHSASFPVSEHYRKGVLIPSDQQGPYMISEVTERQGNGTVLMLHEAPFSMENRAVQQILSSALQGDFFDTLRTKQQTGYIASSWDIEVEDQLLQFFGVQSITHQSSELLSRFELFLEEFSRHMDEKIPLERFNTLKQSLIKELGMPSENIPSKAALLNHLAFEKKGDFDWLQKRISTVQALSYETFLKTASSFLSRQNHRRLAVLMEGVLPAKNQFRYEPISQEKIRDLGPYISAN